MQQISILDTFPDFLGFWEYAQNAPLPTQIELWESEYMAKWPELLHKQLNDYSNQQVNWRHIASEKIFPFINARLGLMKDAHENILSQHAFICHRAHLKIGFESNVIGVIYVGLGCGAGWATTYEEQPAILFGLENIAECHWNGLYSIKGLIAHEFGHVIHNTWRKQALLAEGDGAWWQLFTEGFAQRSEHLILGQNTWHEAQNGNGDWISWCYNKQAFLASEFLSYVAEGKDICSFFGSWYNIEGYSQCGYFLGHECIKELELLGMSFKEIGLLENPENCLREILEQFAHKKRP